MEKSRKQKQQRMGIYDAVIKNGGDIDRLPDDLLINILSHMSIKRAARTSVLSHKWRYLWRFSHGTLRFDGKLMEKEKLESWVNGVLDLHQAPYVEGMIISVEGGVERNQKAYASTSRAVERWLNFAMQKEVQRLELNLLYEDKYKEHLWSRYPFPSLEELRSYSHSHSFCRLRSLRLSHVNITTDVVHHFLASCPDLEELCIQFSYHMMEDLRVVDPPSLRVLEITTCPYVESVEISAASLVSLTYGGPADSLLFKDYRDEKSSLLVKKAPNLRELCITGDPCLFFVLEPQSYSVQLEKLVLDIQFEVDSRILFWVAADLPRFCSLKRLQVYAHTRYDSLFNLFKSLIEASPLLCEFRIELGYSEEPYDPGRYGLIPGKFVHRNLKVVEVGGYAGYGYAEELLVALIWSCPSLERVAIHIPTDFFDKPHVRGFINKCRRCKNVVPFATSREEAKGRAQRFIAKTRKHKPKLQEWKQWQWERLEFIVTLI
ncbi:putative FBD-associated F-box protein At5g56690 isoform X2 [Salvia miltiorrhiza]|uniref:putative FBD-associated F-box protein At5g56690 isoform X2 n=1 Tax=Salvia miltiorrhiza TaxID=226208 RepID=UPI0025ABC4B9|nr:putative FBD-associated F-box protein At5g56690 isoform X2 [Salvia miltiorrhiza]